MAFKFDAVSTTPFEIPGQLMKHHGHMPSFNCVMYDAATRTNDRTQVQRVTVNGEDVLKFRFKSEVGGPFGKIANPLWSKLPFISEQETYSDYNVFLAASGKFYFKSAVDAKDANTYILGDRESVKRMAEIIAGALKCYSSIQNQLPLATLADEIYKNAATIVSPTGLVLPEEDTVQSQVEYSIWDSLATMARNGFGDAYSR